MGVGQNMDMIETFSLHPKYKIQLYVILAGSKSLPSTGLSDSFELLSKSHALRHRSGDGEEEGTGNVISFAAC